VDVLLRRTGARHSNCSFDVAMQTLEHVPSPTFYVAECARLLRPGGNVDPHRSDAMGAAHCRAMSFRSAGLLSEPCRYVNALINSTTLNSSYADPAGQCIENKITHLLRTLSREDHLSYA
jgi:2-polyprenyl-3-methyl-5-hydroxy-6-metoxy-1,4-benzoquinol methylase